MAWRVEPPAPAMMGTFPAQVCTAVATISLYSRGSSEKNSPVPPAANRALAPYGASHSSRSAYAGALKLPPASKSVTGKERRPSPIMVLSSWGVNWDIAFLDIRCRTTYCDLDGVLALIGKGKTELRVSPKQHR